MRVFEVSEKYRVRTDLTEFTKIHWSFNDRLAGTAFFRTIFRWFYDLPRWILIVLAIPWVMCCIITIILLALYAFLVEQLGMIDHDDGPILAFFLVPILLVTAFVPFGWIAFLSVAGAGIPLWLVVTVAADYREELQARKPA